MKRSRVDDLRVRRHSTLSQQIRPPRSGATLKLNDDTLATLQAKAAAEVLIARGWPVEILDEKRDLWKIRNAAFSAKDLVKFSTWAPNCQRSSHTLSSDWEARSEKVDTSDLIDALFCIGAIVDVAEVVAAGTEVEPAIRLIQRVLRSAVSPIDRDAAANN